MVEKESLDGAIHVVHALISLFSCGLWLLVWLFHAMSASGPWRCTSCGADVRRQQDQMRLEHKRQQQQMGNPQGHIRKKERRH